MGFYGVITWVQFLPGSSMRMLVETSWRQNQRTSDIEIVIL
jgi:hypothetical protein